MSKETGDRQTESQAGIDAPEGDSRVSTTGSTGSAFSWMRSPIAYLPLLFALYPVVSLYALNQSEVPLRDLLRPAAAALLSVIAVSAFLRLFSRERDTGRTAFAASLFFLTFFLQDVARHYILLPVWRVVGILTEEVVGLLWQIGCLMAVFWVLRTRYQVSAALPAAIVAGFALLLPPVFNSVWKGMREGVLWAPIVPVPVSEKALAPRTPPQTSSLPDLYCVILDGYGRQDVLERMYGVDNEPFLQALEERGFVIARQSRANYIQTALAMDAALNLEYLKTSDRMGVDDSVLRIRDNRVTKTLQEKGFRIVYVPTTYPLAALESPDIRLETIPPLTEIFTPLERLVLEKTPIAPWMVREFVAFDRHRLRLLGAMDDLKAAAGMAEPKFVLAHILAPHPPFVFGANGESVYPEQGIYKIGDATDYLNRSTPKNYQKGYADQVRYLNRKVLEMVDGVQKNSKRPSVIVLMGDHGPRRETNWKTLEKTNVREAFYNLLAIATTDEEIRAEITGEITPINAIRRILSRVYGENLPRLPDRSYYSTLAYPYHFTDVTEQVAGAEADSSSRLSEAN